MPTSFASFRIIHYHSKGTTHGIYLTTPKLDFDVVKNVRALTDDMPAYDGRAFWESYGASAGRLY